MRSFGLVVDCDEHVPRSENPHQASSSNAQSTLYSAEQLHAVRSSTFGRQRLTNPPPILSCFLSARSTARDFLGPPPAAWPAFLHAPSPSHALRTILRLTMSSSSHPTSAHHQGVTTTCYGGPGLATTGSRCVLTIWFPSLSQLGSYSMLLPANPSTSSSTPWSHCNSPCVAHTPYIGMIHHLAELIAGREP